MPFVPDSPRSSGFKPDKSPEEPAPPPESDNWLRDQLSGFGEGVKAGGERALKRALNFSFGMPGGVPGGYKGVTDPAMKEVEQRTSPIIEQNPVGGFVGSTAVELPIGVGASLLVPGAGAAGFVGRTAHILGQAIPGALQGAMFSNPEDRASGAVTGAVAAPVMQGLAQGVAALGRRALPASRMAAAHLAEVDPVAAEHAFGTPGVIEPTEETLRKAGQRAIDLGATKKGMEQGQRAALVQTINKFDTDALNQTIEGLSAKGARVDPFAIKNDLTEVMQNHFGVPGARPTYSSDAPLPVLDQGRNMMSDLIRRVYAHPDLNVGSDFGNYTNLKRLLQSEGFIKETDTKQFRDMATKAIKDASRVIRSHTEQAAMAADPQVLGPKFVALNKRLSENIPIEEGLVESARRLATQDTGSPHVAYGLGSLIHRYVIGKAIAKSAPYRIGLNQALARAHAATPEATKNVLQAATIDLLNGG